MAGIMPSGSVGQDTATLTVCPHELITLESTMGMTGCQVAQELLLYSSHPLHALQSTALYRAQDQFLAKLYKRLAGTAPCNCDPSLSSVKQTKPLGTPCSRQATTARHSRQHTAWLQASNDTLHFLHCVQVVCRGHTGNINIGGSHLQPAAQQ